MKKLLFATLLIAANLQAGVIINKTTNDEIRLSVNTNDSALEIKLIEDDSVKESKIPLSQYETQRDITADESVNADVFESIVFSRPYKTTEVIAVDAHKEKQYQVYFFMPLMAALDTVFLPVTLPAYLIKRGYTKKDTRTLMSAISDGETIVVNKRRFKRIKGYLNL
jgi:hypothetical protein